MAANAADFRKQQLVFVVAASLLSAACDAASGGSRPARDSGSSDASADAADAMAVDGSSAAGGDASSDASPSLGEDAGDTGVVPTTDSGPGPTYPAELLGGLSGWHLTLPIGESNDADEVNPPELDTYSGPYFALADTRDRVRMVALFGGARTSDTTAYARTELRQDYSGPGALGNNDWPCETSMHAMHVKQRITLTPLHKPEMSVGQIHDDENDLLEVRYIGPEDADGIGTGDGTTDTGTIEAHFNNDTSFKVLDSNYTVGDIMTLDVSTDGSGYMAVHYENLTTGTTSIQTEAFYGSVSGGCYFKAGNYHQACTIEDINGNTNMACADKGWASGRYETDPLGQSVLELLELAAE